MAAKKKTPVKSRSGKHPGGRPTIKNKVDLKLVARLCAAGLTDYQLSVVLNISTATIYNWQRKESNQFWPEFLKTIKENKKTADDEVVRSLFERATGYSHPDTKIATHEGVITDTQEYIKHYPPDSTACIFWLCNRDSENWRQRQEVNHSGLTVNITPPPEDADE